MDRMSNVKRRLITSMGAVVLLVLTIVGITYAYFTSRVKGNTNTKSAEVSAARLQLTYGDGNGLIELLNIQPGVTLQTKTFTVKNTGTKLIDSYDVILENVINELKYTDDLTYTLTCTSSNGTCNGTNGVFPTSDTTIVTNSIDVGVTHTYTLTVTYNETNTDQSDDMNKRVSAKVNIIDEDAYAEVPSILVYGNSIQNGTPTPDNPIEIQSVGDLITDSSDSNYGKYKIPLTVTGKNLFDIDKYIYNLTADSKISKVNDQTLRVQQRSYQENYNLFEMNYKLNTRYTLSFEYEWETASLNQSGFKVRAIYTDETYSDLNSINDVKPSVANQTGKIVATSAENKTISKIVIGYWQYSGIVLIKNIQLEEGTEETEYEPYNMVSTNLILKEPLRKVGDYADYIDIKNNKVVRNIKEQILDGTENYSGGSSLYDSANTTNRYINFPTNTISKTNGTVRASLVNYLPWYKTAWAGDQIGQVTNATNQFHMKFPNNIMGINSEDSISIRTTKYIAYIKNQYDIGNPIKIYYPMATPLEETITIPSIAKIGNISNVSIATTVQPSNIEIKR